MSKHAPHSLQDDTRQGASMVPWVPGPVWGQVHLSLQHLCTRHQAPLDAARHTARDMQSCLETLFPLLDSLCSQTCPACQTPCCHVATVWFDFKDLVFMHLGGLPLATGQLTRTPEGTCSCCGPTGCRLPRLSRPWTCTWYLCPTQKNLLAGMPGNTLARFETAVAAIKRLRQQLEAEFIGITS